MLAQACVMRGRKVSTHTTEHTATKNGQNRAAINSTAHTNANKHNAIPSARRRGQNIDENGPRAKVQVRILNRSTAAKNEMRRERRE